MVSGILNLPRLKIGRIEARYPIIQGGMGVGVSAGRLAAAVSEAGGIGIIATVALGPSSRHFSGAASYRSANMLALRDELDRALVLSSIGNIGTNCMVAITDYENMVRTSLEGGARLIISGAGLPLALPEYASNFPDVALVPIVSSAKAGGLIVRRWEKTHGRLPDAFVVETPNEAGGHLGASHEQVGLEEYSLETVVPQLKELLQDQFKLNIPVIAAGGIWDRADIDHMLALGADGVQMSTRFVCTEECDAPEAFKQVYLDSLPEDVVLIKSPVGLPGRGVRTPFVRVLEAGKYLGDGRCWVNCLQKCSYRDEGTGFCIARALTSAKVGDREHGLFFSGSNVHRCHEITTVARIFGELTSE
ncbi:MAG: NAD(P)H-dependent flavin oxidoreductase [Anaerolineae bacterium]